MRHVRITHPKGVFLGSAHRPPGAVVAVPDDRRARQLVDLGHAEFVVAADPHAARPETATAPPPREKGARR